MSEPKLAAGRDAPESGSIPPNAGTPPKLLIVAAALAAAILALDFSLPLGVAGGVPYVALVLVGFWFQKRGAFLILAAVASFLIFAGYFFSPEGGTGWVVLVNRGYALFTIWLTAIVLWWVWRERAFRSQLSIEKQWREQISVLPMGWEGVVVSILLIVVVASSWGLVSRIEEGAKRDLWKSLRTALETSQVGIHKQLDGQKNAAIIWARNIQIRMAAMELVSLPLDTTILIDSSAQKNLRTWMKPVFRTVGYRGFFVIGNDNINRASTRDSNIGVVNLLTKQGDLLDRVWAGETLVSLPQVSDVPLEDVTGKMVEDLATMFVSAPIKSAGGDVIAILAFRLEPDESFSPIFERSRFGNSGETYAFDRKGLLISESRFNHQLRQIGLITGEHSDLNVELRDPGVNMVLGQKPALPRDKQPLTRMAQSATAGKSGSDLDGYRDYRGVPVVGAWLWDGEYGFGITTEIDVEEAFATFNDMRIVILAFSGLAVGVLIVLAVVSGNSRRRIADAYRRNQLLLTSAGEGIYGLDNRGQTTFVNPAACEMLGYERDELIGQPMHALIHHSYLDGTPYPREKCHMYAAFTDGEVHRIDNEVLWRKDGASFPVEYTSTPILTGDKPTGAVVTFRDVSERRQAETELAESEERLRLALDGAEIGAWIRHLPAGPVIWDTRMRAIHGVTEENAPRSAEEILALIHPDDVDKVKQSASLARSGDGKYLSEHRVIRPDGEMRHVFANAVVLRDENDVPQRVVGITMDVTGQKQSEAELLAAKEAAEKASQAKSEFLSSMSHDLRTPMNSILGFAQVLRTDPEAPLSEDQDDSVEHIAKAGKHLLGLIDEVLDLTRIESGTVSLSPEALEPAMVVNECFDLLHSQAEDRKIFLKAELDADLPGIKADYSRLKDVLLNLLSNAVKYNFEQGTVVVRCQPVPGQRLRLSVADSGPGIPEESLPELFQPFNRLGAEASEIEGTGIGLTITKRLVELMDGEIGVESRQGKGCVFWIELPQAPQAPRGPQTATEADNSGNEVEAAALATGRASHKVLYVEDNPANTRLMRKLIARRPNCTLIEAASGEAGLDLAASERPDIIIMDINLPGIDGFETLRRLRLSEGGGEVPVMALSADAMPKTVDRGLEVGFFAYLTKPIEVAALLEALDAALGGKA